MCLTDDPESQPEIEWDEHQKVKPTQSQIESRYGIPHEKIDEGVNQIDPLLRHELETRLNEVTLATRRETTESKRAFIAAINP